MERAITAKTMTCGHYETERNEHGACAACIAEGKGAKADAGKDRWTPLLTLSVCFTDLTDALAEIGAVLDFGAKKYARGNWANVPNARERYTDALLRHLRVWYLGERNDDGLGGSGRHHLAAAGCCLLFLLALDLRGKLERSSSANGAQVKEK